MKLNAFRRAGNHPESEAQEMLGGGSTSKGTATPRATPLRFRGTKVTAEPGSQKRRGIWPGKRPIASYAMKQYLNRICSRAGKATLLCGVESCELKRSAAGKTRKASASIPSA